MRGFFFTKMVNGFLPPNLKDANVNYKNIEKGKNIFIYRSDVHLRLITFESIDSCFCCWVELVACSLKLSDCFVESL